MTAEMIQIFSQAVRRYIETVDYNLGRRKGLEKRFDRMVYPDDGLRVVDVEIFQQEIREYLRNGYSGDRPESQRHIRGLSERKGKSQFRSALEFISIRRRTKTERHWWRLSEIFRSLPNDELDD